MINDFDQRSMLVCYFVRSQEALALVSIKANGHFTQNKLIWICHHRLPFVSGAVHEKHSSVSSRFNNIATVRSIPSCRFLII